MATSIPSLKALTNISTNLLKIVTTCIFLHLIFSVTCNHNDEFDGFLLCRKCGHEVTKVQNLFSMPSDSSLRQKNDTIRDKNEVLIQLFKNPQGVYFEIITSLQGDLETDVQKFHDDSWFPGYSWSIAKCPKCGTHLGWFYFTMDTINSHVTSFIGLIMDKIMHEDDVNNLIAMPKTYAS